MGRIPRGGLGATFSDGTQLTTLLYAVQMKLLGPNG
jgi:hypothetical protein